MKKTAVEWLIEKLIMPTSIYTKEQIIEQAKEMERRQIIDAYVNGEHQQGFEAEAEQYCNQTFKK